MEEVTVEGLVVNKRTRLNQENGENEIIEGMAEIGDTFSSACNFGSKALGYSSYFCRLRETFLCGRIDDC